MYGHVTGLSKIYQGTSRCSHALAGAMEVIDAFEWVQELVPDFKSDSRVDSEEQYTAVAVFCSADYSKAAEHASLNHWVPGVLKTEVGFAQAQFNQWGIDAKESMETEMKKLEEQAFRCREDPALTASIDTEMLHLKKRTANFLAMQKEMYELHSVICQDARSDGNCAVYTLMSMINDVKTSLLSDQDVAAFRLSLSQMWKRHSAEPMWQHVWEVLRQHLGSTEDLAGDSPEKLKPKAQGDLPFTPDKQGSKRLLPAGNTPDRNGVIIPAMEEAPDTPPEKKPKRTGKPKPLEDRINFQVYFQRWLAEKGITYRSWIAKHRKQHVWVCLGRLTVEGLDSFTMAGRVYLCFFP